MTPKLRWAVVMQWLVVVVTALSVSVYGTVISKKVLRNKTALVFATRNKRLGERIMAVTRKYPAKYTLIKYVPTANAKPKFYGGLPFIEARQIARYLDTAGVLGRGSQGANIDDYVAISSTTNTTNSEEIVFSTVVTNDTNVLNDTISINTTTSNSTNSVNDVNSVNSINDVNSISSTNSTNSTSSTSSTNSVNDVNGTNSTNSTDTTNSTNSTDSTNSTNETNSTDSTNSTNDTNNTNSTSSRVWQNELNEVAAVLSQYNSSVYSAYLLNAKGQVFDLQGKQIEGTPGGAFIAH